MPHPLATLAPAVNFPVTICVVCYGDYPELASRFLTNLYENTPVELFNLRAGLNEVCDETNKLFANAREHHGNVTIFGEEKNIYKNPLMRKMFQSPPVATDWVIWFDDDSYPERKDWLQRLAMAIQQQPGVSQWGKLFKMEATDAAAEEFIRAAEWFRGKPLRPTPHDDRPSGLFFEFATGGYWALKRSAIEALDWPDPRIIQAGEDYLLAEALRQADLEIGNCFHGVRVDDAERRNADAGPVKSLSRD